jgi:hypothetical protein
MWDITLGKIIVLSEGSQAPPTSPSDKGSVKIKTLGQLEAVAWDRGRGILVFWINGELYNLET